MWEKMTQRGASWGGENAFRASSVAAACSLHGFFKDVKLVLLHSRRPPESTNAPPKPTPFLILHLENRGGSNLWLAVQIGRGCLAF